jgi:hypothetical protein
MTRTVVFLILALATPAWSATRCTTYEEQTLNRLHTLCDDGTRAVSTWNKTLSRWESTVTSPPTVTPSQRAPRRQENRR